MPIDRTQLRLNAFNRKRARWGDDLCDILLPTPATVGNRTTLQDAEVVTDIKCFVEEVSGGSPTVVAEGLTVVATHKLTLEPTAESLAITERNKIRVQARGDNGIMIFEQPVRSKESMSTLVVLRAILTSGYRQPAHT